MELHERYTVTILKGHILTAPTLQLGERPVEVIGVDRVLPLDISVINIKSPDLALM
jgi:hypothetical protein